MNKQKPEVKNKKIYKLSGGKNKMKKSVSLALVIFLVLPILGIFLIPSSASSQGTPSFSISLPVPFPPRIANVKIRTKGTTAWIPNANPVNSGIVPGTNVEVTATLIMNAPVKQDGSRGPIGALSGNPELYYSTNYYTANPPTWNWGNLISCQDQGVNNTLYIRSYQCTWEIPASAIVNNQKVVYSIYAKDNYNSSEAKIGGGVAIATITRPGGPGWPGGTPPWNDANTFKVGEISATTTDGTPPPNESKTMADPAASPPIHSQSINNDLDILELYVGIDPSTSSNNLFVKMKVEGTINKGSQDLTAANAYVVALLNRARPNDGGDNTAMTRGTFALLWFENASQTAGLLPANPCFIDVEASLAAGKLMPDGQGSNPIVTAYKSGQYLYFRVPLSALNVTPLTTHPYYDPNCIAGAAGGAVIDARDMDNIKFVIHDITNGFSLYRKNHVFTPKEGSTPPVTTFTLNGSVKDAVSNTGITSGTLKFLLAGSTVATVSLTSQNYTVSLDPGSVYTLRAEIPGYLINEITINAVDYVAQQTYTQEVKLYTPQKGGDLTGDSKVDQQDFNIFVTKYKQTGSNIPGDLNGDNKVDLKDFGIMLRNFNKQTP